MATIAQIGPWPQPWGGISVYVQRLSRLLAANGHRVVVLDHQNNAVDDPSGVTVVPLPNGKSQAARAAREMAARGVQVAHLHLIRLPWKTLVPFTTACEAVGIPLIISVHSFADPRTVIPPAERAMVKLCGARLAAVFASGGHVAERLIGRGLPADKVRAVAPFVPPRRATPVDARLPPVLRRFRAEHPTLIVAGAAALTRTATGADLYGFDVFTQMAAVVGAEYPDAGFVFQLPRHGDEALYGAAMAIAERGQLGHRLLVHTEPLQEASDLWAIADIFARPTRSDGDSVSIREALSLGTPTLASDVVARPAGVVEFPSGDGDAAGTAALQVLANLPAARVAVARVPQPDGAAVVERALVEAAADPGFGRSVRRRVISALAS
ncbi:MAG: glycosyltransferase family 4 protein [Myxococcales bacterium]|nr:glycosyltransferase family 4 protein [Myxococcales bacterium]